MTLLTSISNQVQRAQSKPEYMEDARRRTKPHKTKLQSIYTFHIKSRKDTIHKTRKIISFNMVTKGCASLSGDNLCIMESRYDRDLVGDRCARYYRA